MDRKEKEFEIMYVSGEENKVDGYSINGYDELEKGYSYISVLEEPTENSFSRKNENLRRIWEKGCIKTKVFLVLYAANEKEDKVWFKKLSYILEDEIDPDRGKNEIAKALSFLNDRLLIRREFAIIGNSKATQVYLVDEEWADVVYREMVSEGKTIEEYFRKLYGV